MSPYRLVVGGLLVVVSGALAGQAGALIAVLVVALAVVVRVVLTLPREQRRPLVAAADGPRAPSFPSYNRLYSSVLLAGTSDRHVDLALRPVLLRVLSAELEDLGPEAVRARLGERWWSVVDPERPTLDDSRSGGLDRRSLLELLDRLENR
jgi:hypothetical protein